MLIVLAYLYDYLSNKHTSCSISSQVCPVERQTSSCCDAKDERHDDVTVLSGARIDETGTQWGYTAYRSILIVVSVNNPQLTIQQAFTALSGDLEACSRA